VLIGHERRRLFQAIVFFFEHAGKLGKTKLFKASDAPLRVRPIR
jgi:hypothetical protein